MDEPVAGLAGSEIDELTDLIRLLRRLGVTVILVEHHAELVMSCATPSPSSTSARSSSPTCRPRSGVDPRVVAAYLGDELVDTGTAAS